jgi:hypothetical protein
MNMTKAAEVSSHAVSPLSTAFAGEREAEAKEDEELFNSCPLHAPINARSNKSAMERFMACGGRRDENVNVLSFYFILCVIG